MKDDKWHQPGTRSLTMYMCGRGYITVFVLLSFFILSRHAKVFLPLMFIAQEPQIPSSWKKRVNLEVNQ